MSRHPGSLHTQSPLAGRAMLQPQYQGQYASHSQSHSAARSPNLAPRTRPSHHAGGSSLRHTTIDGEEHQYLNPPSPHSRLLLALLSPIKEEITWALSRLIQGSALYPEHFVLSEWCGLAHRLLSFVRRFNRAARGETDWEWANEEDPISFPDDDLSDSEDEEVSGGSSSRSIKKPAPPFDPRHNEEHYFILNAAVSASLILRNASQDKANAEFLTRDNGNLPQTIFDVLSLPEDLFGFETLLEGEGHHSIEEEELRLEGAREIRLYWMEILRNIAPRIYLYERTDVVRLQDGSVRRTTPQASSTTVVGDRSLVVRTPGVMSAHYTDRIFTHTLLLFYTTGDRALLLAVTRFLAQLLSNARAKGDIFIERTVTLESQIGWSPGIIGRCKELVLLHSLDAELAEAAIDCLDASIDVAIEETEPPGPTGQTGPEEAHPESVRHVFPNALKVLTTGAGLGHTSLSLKQPILILIAQLLAVNASSWERVEALLLHGYLHPLHLIPSRRIHRERLLEHDPDAAEKARSYHALRSIKSESGLVHYTTPTEKRWLKQLEEPQRLKTWLQLVARPAGGPGTEDRNPFYITQMQIWTSYRDSFAPLIDASQRAAARDPTTPALPPLVPAYDVISKIGEVFPTTAAVLVPEEDVRLGGTKFVIRGLEGFLRPEVTAFKCRWRGCPQYQTATRDAQAAHARAHAKLASSAVKCRWASCTYIVSAPPSATDAEKREMLAAHTMTHLTTLKDEPKPVAPATFAGSSAAPSAPQVNGKPDSSQSSLNLSAPAGRAMPLQSTKPSSEVPSQVNPHAVSAPHPSRFTVDRPSSMRFHVYRTPFNLKTGVPEGPAASAARMLQRIAHMCHLVLGSGLLGRGSEVNGAAQEEDDFDKDEKKVKLDFSDRLKDTDKFGMPFALPVNFASVVDRSVPEAAEDGTEDSALKEDDDAREQMSAAEAEKAQRRLEALQSLQSLEAVEDEMVKWAGQNDILSGQLLEALDDMASIRAKEPGSKRKRS
ncbi:hypothetical protein BCV69DRAFT_283499 [Microstroma glucosiphilum]|uniref:RFX-type winged-helix domain-containing protein n=1 Tax=Pseudomicrostroma glucosiphilum TaxID=1684307 RepID=A0A316U558_9BASI|nr:hypothetical protein BCV69DRAFT_283499 [Pseudomicrostroma glucosiphilum]PWN19968.1 hypothetical protein BCV69DRAFT_283499 [Pseudomicrostroma glucosiphilum]